MQASHWPFHFLWLAPQAVQVKVWEALLIALSCPQHDSGARGMKILAPSWIISGKILGIPLPRIEATAMAILNVSVTTDFSLSTLSQISVIGFALQKVPVTAIFAASQFDDTHILKNVSIIGSASINKIFIQGGSINAGTLVFSNWSASDSVILRGSAVSDEIRGSKVNDLIDGDAGNDRIFSVDGVDTIFGGLGDDFISIRDGRVDGGAGNDHLSFTNDLGTTTGLTLDISDGGAGRDMGNGVTVTGIERLTLSASGLNDRITAGNLADTILVISGNDSVFGRGGNDAIVGGPGNDSLRGDSGDDILSGGADNDTLVGGDGADLVIGGLGRDVMSGNGGADRFIFDLVAESAVGATRDAIVDFQQGLDLIDLSVIDFPLVPGEQDFRFVGQTQFRGLGMEVRFFQTATDTVIQGSAEGTDPDGKFEIRLNGLFTLTANDFIL
jgi:Ca2+-binding RTX toxin-like protein